MKRVTICCESGDWDLYGVNLVLWLLVSLVCACVAPRHGPWKSIFLSRGHETVTQWTAIPSSQRVAKTCFRRSVGKSSARFARYLPNSLSPMALSQLDGNSLTLNAAKELLDEALVETRINMDPAEKKQFYDRHVRNMSLSIAQDGTVRIELKR